MLISFEHGWCSQVGIGVTVVHFLLHTVTQWNAASLFLLGTSKTVSQADQLETQHRYAESQGYLFLILNTFTQLPHFQLHLNRNERYALTISQNPAVLKVNCDCHPKRSERDSCSNSVACLNIFRREKIILLNRERRISVATISRRSTHIQGWISH